MENKLKLFQGKSIRSAWNEEEQQWYFSILDVVQVLTDNAMLSNIQSECVEFELGYKLYPSSNDC